MTGGEGDEARQSKKERGTVRNDKEQKVSVLERNSGRREETKRKEEKVEE